MPKRSGAPDVGDLVVIKFGRGHQQPRLVIDARGTEILVMSDLNKWKTRWVRRDKVKIISAPNREDHV